MHSQNWDWQTENYGWTAYQKTKCLRPLLWPVQRHNNMPTNEHIRKVMGYHGERTWNILKTKHHVSSIYFRNTSAVIPVTTEKPAYSDVFNSSFCCTSFSSHANNCNFRFSLNPKISWSGLKQDVSWCLKCCVHINMPVFPEGIRMNVSSKTAYASHSCRPSSATERCCSLLRDIFLRYYLHCGGL